MSDPPRRFVDSELLLRRPECREKGGRFFFVRCVGGFRVSGAGLFPRRSGRVGGMRFDGFALRCETCTAGFRRYRLASQRPASVGGGVSPDRAVPRWRLRAVRSRRSTLCGGVGTADRGGAGRCRHSGGGVEPVRMRRDFPTAILRKGRIRSPSDSFFRFIFITWLLLLFLSLAMFRHLNRATNGQKIG